MIAWGASSCAPSGFASEAVISTVRILASSADRPYAQPGDAVRVQLLAYDGRSADQRDAGAMGVTWLPFVCQDPPNDAYYGCFVPGHAATDAGAPGPAPALDGGTDAGTDGGASGCAPPQFDSGIAVPLISTFNFTMPPGIVAAHPPVPGAYAPYGLAFLFDMACAGHVAPVPPTQDGNPQQVPVGCFDSSGHQLGSDDYVFGYSRIYAYEPNAGPDGGGLRNANPVITGVDTPDSPDGGTPTQTLCFQGAPPTYVTDTLIAPQCAGDGGNCPHVKLGAVVPPSSQEPDPQNMALETLWADYYTTLGGFTSRTRLLYDSTGDQIGGLDKTDTEFEPPVIGPSDPRDGFIFIVVHDNRGGVSWVIVPVHVSP